MCVCFCVHTQKNNKKFEISLASRIKFEEREKDFQKKKRTKKNFATSLFLRARGVLQRSRKESVVVIRVVPKSLTAFVRWAFFFVSLKKKKKKKRRGNLESKINIVMGEKGKKRTQDEMEKGEEDAVEIMPGTIKSVRLQNFMCHEHLLVDLGPRINFITGENGSGSRRC